MRTKSFKDLIVWQKAYRLAREIYSATDKFPKAEKYCLGQQMRKASISVPSNIAEGYGRPHGKDYSRFLAISYGSLCELETQYLLSVDVGYSARNEIIENLIKGIGSMLYVMMHPKISAARDSSKIKET